MAARALLEDVYTNAPMFKTGSLLLSQDLTSVLKTFGGNREVRILEVGAGCEMTTKQLGEKLPDQLLPLLSKSMSCLFCSMS